MVAKVVTRKYHFVAAQPDELKARREALALAERRTFSNFVRLILEDWLAGHDQI